MLVCVHLSRYLCVCMCKEREREKEKGKRGWVGERVHVCVKLRHLNASTHMYVYIVHNQGTMLEDCLNY